MVRECKYIDASGRRVLIEFSNGGLLYDMRETQRAFLASIKGYELTDIGILPERNEYREVLIRVLTTNYYKSGKEQKMLNHIRSVVLNHRLTETLTKI